MTKTLKFFWVLFVLFVIYICICFLALNFIYTDMKNLSNIKSAQSISAAFSAAKRIDRNLKIIFPFRGLLELKPELKDAISEVATLDKSEVIYKELFSSNQQKQILILMQNSSELRPTGGFWGAYGVLTTKGQAISSFESADTYDIDQNLIGRYIAPSPITDIVANQWRFWNANWSPDFEVSVKQGLAFLDESAPTKKYDDVIAVNLDSIISLLKLSGPIKVDGLPFEISADNFIEKMIYEQNSTSNYSNSTDIISSQQKNKSLAQIGQKALGQIISNGKQDKLLYEIIDGLKNKRVFLYSRDQIIQDEIKKLDWSGNINTQQNFVMTVDANFGSKLDLLIDKTMIVKKTGPNTYTADITYSNPGQKVTDEKQLFSNYRDVVRIFLPIGAKIVSHTGGLDFHDLIQDKDLDALFISNLVIIEPNQFETLHLEWSVPENSGSLKVIDQSGSNMKIYTQ